MQAGSTKQAPTEVGQDSWSPVYHGTTSSEQTPHMLHICKQNWSLNYFLNFQFLAIQLSEWLLGLFSYL